MCSVDKRRAGRILLGIDIGGTGIKGARVERARQTIFMARQESCRTFGSA